MVNKTFGQEGKPLKKIKFIIDSDLENAALIGMAINKLCSLIPLSDVESFQIELCAIEAINNSIIHAYGREINHEVETVFRLYGDRLILDVFDAGKSMDQNCLKNAKISSFGDDPKAIDDIPESGRGLAVIKEIMDSITYETKDGKNCFTMIKKTPVGS